MSTVTLNLPCLCGSAKKFRLCCGKNAATRITFEYLHGAMSSANLYAKEEISGQWDEQRQQVKKLVVAIRENMPGSPLRAAVFGAGNCSDIPLEYLAESFEKVDLFDIDWSAINKARERLDTQLQKKVRCFLFDVTGLFTTMVPKVVMALEKGNTNTVFEVLEDFYQKRINPAHLPRKYDLVLSVNMLTQLFTPFMVSVGKAAAFRGLLRDPVSLDSYIKFVQKIGEEIIPEHHLQFLRSVTKSRLLITTDKFLWGDLEGIPEKTRETVENPEDLLKPEVQEKLAEQNLILPGTKLDLYYPKYFHALRKNQWLWHFNDQKVYLVEGYELAPK